MSLAITLSTGAAAVSRLIGRQALGWTAAAALGAGSGYYAGSGGLETGHAIAPPSAAVKVAPRAPAADLVPATLDQPAPAEPQPPAS